MISRETPKKVYLDSDAVIRFIESQENSIASVFDMAGAGTAEIFTSELTPAEVLVAPVRDRDDELVAYDKDFLMDDDIMTVVPIDRKIRIQSAELRAMSGGKTPDSLHVATAMVTGCTVIVSSDKRLRLPSGMVRIAVESADNLDLWP